MDPFERLERMHKSDDPTERVVEALWCDVTGRRGWRHAADEFDDDVIHSILDDWLVIVRTPTPDKGAADV